MSDIKKSTVDKAAEQIKKNSNLSSEQAHRIAADNARRLNRETKEKK